MNIVSFSGGRSSALMLKLLLDEHGGQLPDDWLVSFQNTGKEREATLRFVHDCATHWSVPIVWLQYRDDADGWQRFEEVGYNSAARDGEPFEALIKRRNYVPNQVARFCTQELKIRTQERWLRSKGIDRWTAYIGFRADEQHRVMRAKNCMNKRRWDEAYPLYDHGITKGDVREFWRQQPFDLQLQDHEGNCDLCFLKQRAKLRTIMYDSPDLAAWWIRMEQTYGTFRAPDRPNYSALYQTREKQEEMFDMDALDIECACTD